MLRFTPVLTCICILFCLGVYYCISYSPWKRTSQYLLIERNQSSSGVRNRVVIKSHNTTATCDQNRSLPVLFIGGVPRSGTTLMRAMLDAHPKIHCGKETRVVPRILSIRKLWTNSTLEHSRLLDAGIKDNILDSAVAAFILKIITKDGKASVALNCNKDPFVLLHINYLADLFPRSQFILMLRDGRAVVNSVVSRKIKIAGWNCATFPSCLQRWNRAVRTMYVQCQAVGAARCMPLHYEQLVTDPRYWMKKILKFLGIEWSERVLHHEDYINKTGGISISKSERSSDQVVKPIYRDALNRWRHTQGLNKKFLQAAPMLHTLGYISEDPNNYDEPTKFRRREKVY